MGGLKYEAPKALLAGGELLLPLAAVVGPEDAGREDLDLLVVPGCRAYRFNLVANMLGYC